MSKNTEQEKVITFRVSAEEHRKIRIKAAEDGDLSPNQFSKSKLFKLLELSETKTQK